MPQSEPTPTEPQGGQESGASLDGLIDGMLDGAFGDAEPSVDTEAPEAQGEQPSPDDQPGEEDLLDGLDEILGTGEEPEGDEGEQEDDDDAEPENNPAWLKGRLERERRKITKEFQDQIAALENRLTEAKKQKSSTSALSEIDTAEGLEDYAQKARAAEKQLRRMARSYERNQEEVEQQFKETFGIDLSTSEDPVGYLEQYADNIQDEVDTSVPKRREFLEKRRNVLAATEQKFAWFKDVNSPMRQEVDTFLGNTPGLASVPEAPFLTAAAVVGMRVMDAAAKRKSASNTSKPPKAPAPGAAPASRKSQKDQMAEIREKARLGDPRAQDEFFASFAPIS